MYEYFYNHMYVNNRGDYKTFLYNLIICLKNQKYTTYIFSKIQQFVFNL